MVTVRIESLGHQSLQGLPDELDRIELRRVWWKENEMDVQGFSLRKDLLGMMYAAVIRYHHDRTVIVPSSDGFKEHAHVIRFGTLREFYDRSSPDGIESHRIGLDLVRVLDNPWFLGTPFANSVRNGLGRGFILKTEDEILGFQTVHNIFESFFKTVSASAGRRWSIG